MIKHSYMFCDMILTQVYINMRTKIGFLFTHPIITPVITIFCDYEHKYA